MKPKILTFGSDTKLRKRFFTNESFAHPAKMHLGLQIYLIENFTEPGEIILDPMGGCGSLLMATTISCNVVLVELEKKFCDMIEQNWQKIKSLGPMLSYTMGEAIILQGDARDLRGLLADKVVFSPPYARDKGGEKGMLINDPKRKDSNLYRTYSSAKGNIDNLPYGEIDAVISNPPYGNRLSDDACKDNDSQKMSYRQSLKADAVITSPPYAETQTGGGIAQKGYQGSKHSPTDLVGKRSYTPEQIGRSIGQIGNMKGDNYLTEMLKVYRQCHSVLKDGGLMCLVVKNFIRDKKIVRLDLDTIKLCETAGFILKERLARKLTQQSFWRRIYEQKYPDAPKIEFEDILIFEKPA